ncbi:MAG: IPT/TIG domain-containing protein [Dehalococcoidia bacterium]
MRLLSRLLVILTVCLMVMALPAAPAQADSGGPYITLDPDDGVIGTNVTIRGSNFSASTGFDIYYYRNTARVLVVEVETNENGYFKDSFIIPESYQGVHEVRAYIGNNKTATGNFTVEPGLTVSPQKGLVGTSVTVEGHGFAQNEKNIELRYYLNGNYTPIASNIAAYDAGNWAQSFKIPPSAKGSHRIDAKGANSTLTVHEDATFEVTPGINLDKLSGSVGENITMTGNGFVANDTHIKILFAGQEVETKTINADAKGYWQESFKVPEMPKGMYTVTAYGESTPKETVSAFSFAIKPDIVLPPGEGHVGMDLTVTGQGFAANKDVFIKYDGSQVATDATDNNGSFDVSFVVPKSQHGEHQVTAADAAVNNAIAIFTMESVPPPVPELKLPSDGSRVGFIGKVRPTLEWSEVFDDSGVYYSLQIATSTNVTATGEFVHPLVSVEGLVETSYTLNETDALPYGTYYWIVQAVDGAENAGNWTAARSFRAGLLPMWGFIAAIVAIVVLIGVLVYFLVVRRRRTHYY